MSGGIEPGTAVALVGDPAERGRAQAVDAPSEDVLRTLFARIDAARSAGQIDRAAEKYLGAQREFSELHCPTAMAELGGIAEGFGVSVDDLFTHLHLGTLKDIARGSPCDHDGCSAWAVSRGPDGPMVVKNRDFSGLHVGIQRIFRHEGPELDHGPMLCLGSLGSPGAYSSGMNSAGLAVADTQVGVRHHGVGWLRYFLMTELLARTATVADAYQLIRSVPHAGGGTLVLADATGAVAAIELGAGRIAIEQSDIVARTNHFTTAALASDTYVDAKSGIDSNSVTRRHALDRLLPIQNWDVGTAMALMAQHEDDAGCAPICQHGAEDGTKTIASTVYCCRSGLMYSALNAPCFGGWREIVLTP